MPLVYMKFMLSGLGSRMRTMASAAAGSNSWVQVKTHRTIGDAVAHLKGQWHADSGNPSF